MVVAGFFQLNQPVVFILFCSILFYSILLIPLVWDIQTLGVQQWIYMHRFCKNLYETLFPRIWHLCMECSWISLSVWYWNARTKEENNKNDSSSQGFSARISSCFQLLYSNHNSFSWLMFSGSLMYLPFKKLFLNSQVMLHSKILYNGIHNEFLD